jgi:hypothetical protein
MRKRATTTTLDRLRVAITLGDGWPRIFDRVVNPFGLPLCDVHDAITEAAAAFNEAFSRALERRRHDRRKPLDDTRDGDRAA